MTSNDHGVPTGIVGSPLLFSEIVPDAAREKRLARAGVVATARRVNQRRAAFAERVVIAMTALSILTGEVGGPCVEALLHSNDSHCHAKYGKNSFAEARSRARSAANRSDVYRSDKRNRFAANESKT